MKKTSCTKELFDLYRSVDNNSARLQTATCNELIEMLNTVPGVILGDDVGMGKTYTAFSTAVYFLKANPTKKIIIVTPNWHMNNKWYTDIRNFIAINLIQDSINLTERDVYQIQPSNMAGSYLSQLQNAQKKKVILIPTNVFGSRCSQDEKIFYLCCWFKRRKLHNETRRTILTTLKLPTYALKLENCQWTGSEPSDIDDSLLRQLDTLYAEKKLSDTNEYNRIFDSIKYRLMRKVMPNTSLLVLDEAHKLKNEHTVKRAHMTAVVSRKFARALFLTATPFQLNDDELKSVLNVFDHASISKDMHSSYAILKNELFEKLTAYKSQMYSFENYVKSLSKYEEIMFEKLVNSEETEDLPRDVKDTFTRFKELIVSKNELEKTMRQLIVRNTKNKNEYRNEVIGSFNCSDNNGLPLSEEAYIPYALIEKAINEIMEKGDRTFISNVKQTFTSSFSAVKSSSVMKRSIQAVNMINSLNVDNIDHPKLSSVCDAVISNQINGEKTLVFCNRIETMKELQDQIYKKLDKEYERDIIKLFGSPKSFSNYYKRFYSKYDVLWFILQENYIYSVLIPFIRLKKKTKRIMPTEEYVVEKVKNIYSKYDVSKKTNYQIVKRAVEHVCFAWVINKIPDWDKDIPDALKSTIETIASESYIDFGLSKNDIADELSIFNVNSREEKEEEKNITESVRNVLKYEGLWSRYSTILNSLFPDEREDLVASMISFLRKDRRFFLELRKAQDHNINYKNDYSYLVQRTFKKGGALDWFSAYKRFIESYCDEETPPAQRDEMKLALKNSDIIEQLSGDTDTPRRARIMAGFNSPFYPQIVIATSVMQEGVDLQKECKIVIHYDLEWNPATLEQRNGRIDRIGSLISKLREEENSTATMDIYYPFIKNTIDESIYKTVKDREKWFNILLGGTPDWKTFEIDPDITTISSDIFKQLQIRLSVDLDKWCV